MRTLIIVDVQNDFCPGGALAVAGGDAIVPVINAVLPAFDMVVATRDWHPADHGSFAANHPGHSPGEVIELNGLPQMLWPVHCVQDSPGAEFHPDLDVSGLDQVFFKGQDRGFDSYSGFFDNGRRRDIGLRDWLKAHGATSLFICGLATDYCVKWTALDACQLGFATWVITDAVRGVDLAAGDSQKALAEMRAAGVGLLASAQIGGERWQQNEEPVF